MLRSRVVGTRERLLTGEVLEGFEALGSLLEGCDCYELRYSDLHDAVPRLTALLDGLPPVEASA